MYLLFYWRCFVIAKNDDLLINERITAKEVMVIGPSGEQLGVKSLQDALTLANAAGFDLVQMNGNSDKPVCKLMDYNKFKYERNKKQKEALKKQKSTSAETKEIRLSVKIDIHDFNTRVNQTVKFLEKGHKIKAVVRFKGREMAHPELGKDVLDRFIEAVKDYGTNTNEPTMEFRTMYVMISPNK
ncbi:MAG: translation initiation factor IF-3 [Bacilli bacterium]|nr:translation initiation factor IF-3 [Bacilli bacterium]